MCLRVIITFISHLYQRFKKRWRHTRTSCRSPVWPVHGCCSLLVQVFRISPLCIIQDDARQLLRTEGSGDLSEGGGGFLSWLGCVWVHRFTGETPGPFPLQLLPHQLPTGLGAQVSWIPRSGSCFIVHLYVFIYQVSMLVWSISGVSCSMLTAVGVLFCFFPTDTGQCLKSVTTWIMSWRWASSCTEAFPWVPCSSFKAAHYSGDCAHRRPGPFGNLTSASLPSCSVTPATIITTMMPVPFTSSNLCRCQCCVWTLPMTSSPPPTVSPLDHFFVC